MEITAILANEFNLKAWQCEAVVKLHDEGCTVPFIARYRKEAHGSLDDQTIHNLLERLEYLRNFEARREEIRTAISELGQMTDEIGASLDAAKILSELEDIYRPFRQKRRTRATAKQQQSVFRSGKIHQYRKRRGNRRRCLAGRFGYFGGTRVGQCRCAPAASQFVFGDRACPCESGGR